MSGMTRKHFEAVALVLEASQPEARASADADDIWREVVEGFVKMFRVENPRFDAERFRRACGMEE